MDLAFWGRNDSILFGLLCLMQPNKAEHLILTILCSMCTYCICVIDHTTHNYFSYYYVVLVDTIHTFILFILFVAFITTRLMIMNDLLLLYNVY